MAERRSYTPEQIAEALAALELNGGNVKRTAVALGIPRPTLILWRGQANAAAGGVTDTSDTEKKGAAAPWVHDFAALWAEAQEVLIRRVIAVAATGSLKDVAVAAGIAADKHQDYAQGRKGAATQVNVDASTKTVQIVYEDMRTLPEGTE